MALNQSNRYAPAQLYFHLQAEMETPTHSSSPVFDVIFSQNQPNSWVDIVVEVGASNSEQTRKTPLPLGAIMAKTLPFNTLPVLRSLLEEKIPTNLLVIRLLNSRFQKQRVSLEVETTFQFADPQYFRFKYHFTWASNYTLSSGSPSCAIQMGERPERITLTNVETKSFVIRLFWLVEDALVSHTHTDNCQITVHTSQTTQGRSINCRAERMKLRSGPQGTYYVSDPQKPFYCVHSRQTVDQRLAVQRIFGCVSNSAKAQTSQSTNSSEVRAHTTKCKAIVFCDKFAFAKHNRSFVFLVFHFDQFMNNCNEISSTISWLHAAKLCRSAGAFLPSVNSRDDMLQLTNLTKSSAAVFRHVWVILVGLVLSSEVGKRRFLCNCRTMYVQCFCAVMAPGSRSHQKKVEQQMTKQFAPTSCKHVCVFILREGGAGKQVIHWPTNNGGVLQERTVGYNSAGFVFSTSTQMCP